MMATEMDIRVELVILEATRVDMGGILKGIKAGMEDILEVIEMDTEGTLEATKADQIIGEGPKAILEVGTINTKVDPLSTGMTNI